MKKQKPNGRCVMCNIPKEKAEDKSSGRKGIVYFLDFKSDEQLCIKCNRINDSIYHGNEKSLKGVFNVEDIK